MRRHRVLLFLRRRVDDVDLLRDLDGAATDTEAQVRTEVAGALSAREQVDLSVRLLAIMEAVRDLEAHVLCRLVGGRRG